MNASRALRRMKKGRRAGAVCVMAGALLVCEPFVAGAFAATQPGNTGAATISINLPAVTVTDPVGGNRALSLGSVSLTAQSYPSLGASLFVGNLSAMGQALAGHSVSTSSGSQSGDLNVPVSAGPVSGSVGVAGYTIQAGNGSASVSAHALNGHVGVAPLGLDATLGPNGVSTSVSPTGATTSVAVSTPGLSVNLANLLPSNLLNGLPLGLLATLAQSLGLQLPSTVTGALSQLQSVGSTLGTLDTNLTNLSNAEAQVASLTSADTTIQAAQQAVTAAQQTVTQDTATVASAQTKLSTDQGALSSAQSAASAACSIPIPLPTCASLQAAVTAAQSTVTADQTALTSDQAALTSAQATLATAQTALNNAIATATGPGSPLATAQALVTQLTNTVNGLLSQLQGLLGSLPNLQNLLAQLVAAVGNAPLLNVGTVTEGINTAADSHSGRSSVTCAIGALSVLGSPVSGPTCSGLTSLLPGIESKISGVLAALPVSTKPGVSLNGPQTTSTGTTNPSSSGATSARAGLSALHLTISPVSLKALADSLTAQLSAQLGQALSALGVSGHAVAHGVTGVTLPSGLSGALTTLSTQVSALPTGSALNGLSTLGLDAQLGGLNSQSQFQSASAATPASGSPTSGTPGSSPAPTSSTPGTTPGSSPTPAGTLASTGASELASVAAGLLLIVTGAQLLVFRRLPAPALVPVRRRRLR